MRRIISAALVALCLSFVPSPARSQIVLRDDVRGWGWLALTPTHRALVHLGYGSLESRDQGRLDSRVLSQLRERGVRRIWGADSFEPTENQVLAECSAVDWTPPGADQEHYGLHTEISFWDHTRLSATEIYESLDLGVVAPTDLASDTYVDACVEQLTEQLVRLGFDEG